ncbi:MAG: hypothetical protein L3J46_02660, partial [Kangiellaceae bacterium]|nr:hypothetical protein [Kangiellaceae bacterium]
MTNSLFNTKGEIGSVYENLRTGSHDVAVSARIYTDTLWSIFRKYSDRNFENQLKIDFHARFWEMYLSCFLLSKYNSVEFPKPGPDILIKNSDKNIWIEAIAPSQG